MPGAALVGAAYDSLGYDGFHDWPLLQDRYTLAVLFEYAATLGLIGIEYVPPVGAREDYRDNWGGDDLDQLSCYDGLLALCLNWSGGGIWRGHEGNVSRRCGSGSRAARSPVRTRLRTPAGSRPSCATETLRLSNLAMALLGRHEYTGDGTDLDESIEASRATVEDAAPDEPARGKFLSNLGTALLARFERTGDDRDLHAAIDAGEEAVRTAPAGHPDLPAIRSNLGAAIQARAERTGAGHDDAVQLARAAVHAVPAGHLDRALVLVSLGTALHERAERTGESKDLDEAIAVLRARRWRGPTEQSGERTAIAPRPDRSARTWTPPS
ncbi:hypothetical protein ABZW44_06400 [Streptomyces mirabilis]|uniref:hypothetical protein n=1 Tax=Streptomyces mirabilis TaxID=68239 RepID=UPI00339E6CAE